MLPTCRGDLHATEVEAAAAAAGGEAVMCTLAPAPRAAPMFQQGQQPMHGPGSQLGGGAGGGYGSDRGWSGSDGEGYHSGANAGSYVPRAVGGAGAGAAAGGRAGAPRPGKARQMKIPEVGWGPAPGHTSDKDSDSMDWDGLERDVDEQAVELELRQQAGQHAQQGQGRAAALGTGALGDRRMLQATLRFPQIQQSRGGGKGKGGGGGGGGGNRGQRGLGQGGGRALGGGWAGPGPLDEGDGDAPLGTWQQQRAGDDLGAGAGRGLGEAWAHRRMGSQGRAAGGKQRKGQRTKHYSHGQEPRGVEVVLRDEDSDVGGDDEDDEDDGEDLKVSCAAWQRWGGDDDVKHHSRMSCRHAQDFIRPDDEIILDTPEAKRVSGQP